MPLHPPSPTQASNRKMSQPRSFFWNVKFRASCVRGSCSPIHAHVLDHEHSHTVWRLYARQIAGAHEVARSGC